ncbi:hypothetical protein T07_4078 [Trichinella nelsoni]|uniref:Uncharacterized protein n=1 Tax=Trichinella nelsoni TaxID=6336 RepID=A0A0V0RS55_9BILA|nr:hypothetical protein T07_4078 [Trichinella nelsoni]
MGTELSPSGTKPKNDGDHQPADRYRGRRHRPEVTRSCQTNATERWRKVATCGWGYSPSTTGEMEGSSRLAARYTRITFFAQ